MAKGLPMTLFIAVILLNSFNYPWYWYIAAVLIWIAHGYAQTSMFKWPNERLVEIANKLDGILKRSDRGMG
jgi:hypothetical protein